jgi:hypothetical protein
MDSVEKKGELPSADSAEVTTDGDVGDAYDSQKRFNRNKRL